MGIAENLNDIRGKISAAAAKSGRTADDITLVAVTKYSTPAEVMEAVKAGQRVFAENRVQNLLEKLDAIDEMRRNGEDIPELTWHLIGHLQTNKVRYVVGRVALIESVDSLRLANEIGRISTMKGVTTDILLEVNVSGEESKSGASPDEVDCLLEEAVKIPGICVKGFMTMCPREASESEIRKIFSTLYEIFVDKRNQSEYYRNMTYLSMGMTNDFVYGIEEGANVVRVGHGIFG